MCPTTDSKLVQTKKDYCTVKGLRDKSGFGWDEELSLVTAPDDVWDKLAKVRLCLLL